MKNFGVFVGIIIAILTQVGCSSDEDSVRLSNATTVEAVSGLSAPPIVGNVVLENMYEDEAQRLASKTPLELITVIEGTNKVVLQARFRSIQQGPYGFPVYECELIDESAKAFGGIAQGMSGSPVGPPGRVMGALAFGRDYLQPPYRFSVTPIDWMETALHQQTFGEMLDQELAAAAPPLRATFTPVKIPVIVTGIQPHRLQGLSSQLSNSKLDFVEFLAGTGGAPAAPLPGATTQLSAGDMIGAAIATGDIVNVLGFGTVTQVYDNQFVAFGHAMSRKGKSALPVYRAVTHGIVSRLSISHKSASAYGSPIGTITKDLSPAIVGELGEIPEMIPVKFSYQSGNNPVIEKNHVVAYGEEEYIPLVALATMEAIRLETSPGTVEGAVTLHFQETEKVYTESFRSASPSKSMDVLRNTDSIIKNFTDTLINTAGKATLKQVSISVTDSPQIAKAEIDEIILPAAVMPGETLSVGIVLLPHWSAAGAERTIQREVTLEIPEDFPTGDASVRAAASFVGSPGEFGTPLDTIVHFEFEDFDEDAEKRAPKNLDELIQQLEENQVDAGLITVTLTPTGGAFPFLEESPPPEALLPPGEQPPDGELPQEFPEEFLPPLPDDFPVPEDDGPPPSVEVEILIDGFVVTGSKDAQIMIKTEAAENGPIQAEGEENKVNE